MIQEFGFVTLIDIKSIRPFAGYDF
jgi:hypothetical protein